MRLIKLTAFMLLAVLMMMGYSNGSLFAGQNATTKNVQVKLQETRQVVPVKPVQPKPAVAQSSQRAPSQPVNIRGVNTMVHHVFPVERPYYGHLSITPQLRNFNNDLHRLQVIVRVGRNYLLNTNSDAPDYGWRLLSVPVDLPSRVTIELTVENKRTGRTLTHKTFVRNLSVR